MPVLSVGLDDDFVVVVVDDDEEDLARSSF